MALGGGLRNGPGTERDSAPQPATEKWKTHLKVQSSRALQHGFFLLWEKQNEQQQQQPKEKKKNGAETLKPWRRGNKSARCSWIGLCGASVEDSGLG